MGAFPLETANEWQNRPLKKFYTFLFVDCLYVNIRKDPETKGCAVYVVLGYDVNGIKNSLGIRIGDAEGKHYWMQIFDEIRNRSVEDIVFISMDGVSGLEEGARSIFKDVTVLRKYTEPPVERLQNRSLGGLSKHGVSIRKLLMYGCVTGSMWNSCIITGVPYEK